MYLHLGADITLPLEEVLCIIDLRNIARLPVNKTFIRQAEKDKQLRRVGPDEEMKTMILTPETVYLSPISSATLKKRIQDHSWLELTVGSP